MERKVYNEQLGRKITVRLNVFFPKKDPNTGRNKKLIFGLDKLTENIKRRRMVNKIPLVVINASCYSENNIYSWTRSFLNAIEEQIKQGTEKDYQNVRDVPHVFGSFNSFKSEGMEVLDAFTHPLESINYLASGKTPAFINKYLNGTEV